MHKFELFNQVSLIENFNGGGTYLYNWLNDIGVLIDSENIISIDDKNSANSDTSFGKISQNITTNVKTTSLATTTESKTTQTNDRQICFSDKFAKQHIDFLIQNSFIFQQKPNLSFYENRYFQQIARENETLRLTLLPAGYACNFDCVYCYENHDSSEKFTDIHIDKLVNFIKLKKHKTIYIEYFGGEPLLNIDWILKFEKAIENITHVSTMTTNGYLLTTTNLKSLISHNVKNFQITLDGVATSHNELRIKKGGGKTYDKILQNLKDASKLDEKFGITLRCNFNEKNSSHEQRNEFFENIKFTQKDFRFRLIFRPIGLYSQHNGTTTQKTLEACHKGGQQTQNTWEHEALKRGYLLGDIALFTRVGGSVCYASKKESFVITPNCELLKCTVAVDSEQNKFGFLDRESDGCVTMFLDKNKLEVFYKHCQFDQKCSNCFFFFQCFGRNCPVNNNLVKNKRCPIKKSDEKFLVEKIVQQKQIFQKSKETKFDN